jgi:hypothetical protein
VSFGSALVPLAPIATLLRGRLCWGPHSRTGGS